MQIDTSQLAHEVQTELILRAVEAKDESLTRERGSDVDVSLGAHALAQLRRKRRLLVKQLEKAVSEEARQGVQHELDVLDRTEKSLQDQLNRDDPQLAKFALSALVQLEPEDAAWQLLALTHLRDTLIVVSDRKAEELVKQQEVRERICAAVQSITDDVFEIAKLVTPILVGLVVSGVMVIPLVPPLLASVALVIGRMGIASLCRDNSDSSSKRN